MTFMLSMSSLAHAQSLEIKANSIHELDLTHLNEQGVHEVHFGKLILNDKSVLLIPSIPSDQVVKIIVDELEVHGKAYIAQAFDKKLEYLFQSNANPFDHFNLLSTAQNVARGRDGSSSSEEVGANAGHGENGADGIAGKSTIKKLILDIHIKKIDKLVIALISQNGGNGGDGGNGGRGGPADAAAHGGNGGNGGNGGKGGLPGNTGSVELYWQSDYPMILTGELPVNIQILQAPGLVGRPGRGGNGGLGGDAWHGLWRMRGGDNGANGAIGESAKPNNEYFFFGSVGNVKVINKDNQ